MLIKVVAISVLPPHRLKLEFSDGTIGVYDCSHIVSRDGPMVLPLREEAYFKRVFVQLGAPTWPNGFDLAPWALHKELADAGKLERAKSQDAAE